MFVGHVGAPAAVSGLTGNERSVRLRASALASLSWTPGSAGNRKLLTKRFCVRRCRNGTLEVVASAGTASIDRFYFDSSDRLCLDVLGTARLVTTQVFRDPSEIYILGFTLDVANGTAASRAAILVNDVEVSSYSTDGRALITNTDTNWNDAVVQYYGRDNAGNYFDGYLTQIASVDGSNSITYSQTDANNIVIPKGTPTATWGAKGHLLTFRDTTSTTTLGYDTSGNSNHFTCNNISLTSGVTYDSMLDYPVNGTAANGIGCYAALDPLHLWNGKSSGQPTISDGNLKFSGSGGWLGEMTSTLAMPSGDFCCEVVYTTLGLSTIRVGICNIDNINENGTSAGSYAYASNGDKYNGTLSSAYGATWTTGDVIGIRYNNGTLTFYKNGVSQGNAFTSLSGTFVFWIVSYNSTATVNFGQRPFTYSYDTAKALNTTNLPSDAVVTSGSFTGNASADGPVVYLGGVPTTLTINGNAVTWGTHADKLATGFKIRTSLSSYNASGTNTFTATAGDKLANNPRAQ